MRRPLLLAAVMVAACTPSPPAPGVAASPRASRPPTAARSPLATPEGPLPGTPTPTSEGPRPGMPTPTPEGPRPGTPGPAGPPSPPASAVPAPTPTPSLRTPLVETLLAGGLDGPLPFPKALALGADGAAYVQVGERIVAVDLAAPAHPATTLVPAGRLVQPQAIAVGPDGTRYAVDSTRHRIVALAADGAPTPLAGSEAGFADGPGAAARFTLPAALAVAGTTLYVADANSVRAIALADPAHPVTTLAGAAAPGTADGPLGTSRIADPRALALAGTTLYIGDFYKVRALDLEDPAHAVTTVAGAEAGDVDGPGGEAGTARFGRIQGLALAGGRLYVADRQYSKLKALTLSGPPTVTTVLAEGLDEPGGLAADAQGRLYVTAYAGHALKRITLP